MSKPNLQEKDKPVSEQEEGSLKGTFTFVLFLGSFLVITWFIVFILFLTRI
ncbi:hypothetical protein [Evansella cellulosilytica]|uniref:Cytochrome c oxidase subunit 2A n=1 Tax=Evansella cellulosilytica (strain ATCC 21833 / DSM 2522 / FERM P-1141 / JCM 9156 / N-4) TaxID=649639 RepID=E6TV34_EVAC2|nr:hypothetical protein [Evansella cellulosilytica]ADU28617.1 hypothetical protein Bcell_0331 [Evansella cellulosilytica DSM 2522]